MSISQGTAAVLCGWEDNRRSGDESTLRDCVTHFVVYPHTGSMQASGREMRIPPTLLSHQLRPSGVYCCRPTAWNSLPDYLRDPSLSEDTFRRLLKTYLFALY